MSTTSGGRSEEGKPSTANCKQLLSPPDESASAEQRERRSADPSLSAVALDPNGVGGETPQVPSRHRRRSPQAPPRGSAGAIPLQAALVEGVTQEIERERSKSVGRRSGKLSSHGSEEGCPTSRPSIAALLDETDAGSDEAMATGTPDPERTRLGIEKLAAKIQRTKELIREEQRIKDENVNEYLKVTYNVDPNQISRLKQLFEKRNNKTSQNIKHLQAKLEAYQLRLRELEVHGMPKDRMPKEMLRDVGQGLKQVGGNIKDGITGLSGTVMAKPREFAHLIRNKFGSADNISSLQGDGREEGSGGSHHGSSTLPSRLPLSQNPSVGDKDDDLPSLPPGPSGEDKSLTSAEESANFLGDSSKNFSSPKHNNLCFRSGDSMMSVEVVIQELQDRRDEIERLQMELENLKKQVTSDVDHLSSSLQEERYRSERLEEMINDLTELHQVEVGNLKQGVMEMEEKVSYQSEERVSDLRESLEACQTRISRLEHQYAQHQQLVTLDAIQNSTARALAIRGINVVLTVLQMALLVIATSAEIVLPFVRTANRKLASCLLVALLALLYSHWPWVSSVSRTLYCSLWTCGEGS